MKIYYIEDSGHSWTLRRARNKKVVRRAYNVEQGRGQAKNIRPATQSEIEYFTNLYGEIDECSEY